MVNISLVPRHLLKTSDRIYYFRNYNFFLFFGKIYFDVLHTPPNKKCQRTTLTTWFTHLRVLESVTTSIRGFSGM